MITSHSPLFYGAASEVITPFSAHGKLELGLLRNEIEFMLAGGITGFFVNGLASEALMMSDEDRRTAAMTVRMAAEGKVPVMGNIIANSISEGVRYAREYQEMGLAAISITPPLIYKYSADGLYAFFTEIAAAVDLPAYIYNAPETGNKLAPNLVARILNANPRFLGYKDSTQNIIELQTLLQSLADGRHFELMSGSDALTMPIMMLGGIGVISLISVVFPKLIVESCAACSAQDWTRATELQNKVLRVREALKIGPFMAAYKYVGAKVGTPLGVVKPPLAGLNEKEMDAITSGLSAEGLL
jgi:4-hydroxy-tetrahydrodipicolinate synthase